MPRLVRRALLERRLGLRQVAGLGRANLFGVLAALGCVTISSSSVTPASAQDNDGPAASEGLARLADALHGNESFKVRAMAAVQLARLGDPRAAGPPADAPTNNKHHSFPPA